MGIEAKSVLIGFLGRHLTEEGDYLGGLLVTNETGVPKEFRHTQPIRPTQLQKMIYGDTLDRSIGSEAIAQTLLSELTCRPDILCINSAGRTLFGSFAVEFAPSAMIIREDSAEHALPNTLAPEGNLLDATFLNDRSSKGGVLVAYIEDDSDRSGEIALLKVAEKMNVESAFERITQVLIQVEKASKAAAR